MQTFTRKSSKQRGSRRLKALGVVTIVALVGCANSGDDSSPQVEAEPLDVASTEVPRTTAPPAATTPPGPLSGSRENDDDLDIFSLPLPRTSVDRPDDSDLPSVKVLYVVPTWAKDRERDLHGDIAKHVFAQNEWLASQNGGFGVRLDTFNGALDIGFASLDVSKETWSSWFDENLAPAAEALRQLGWPIASGESSNGDDLYYVVWEAFAGNYKKTGQGSGTCRPTIDAMNAGYRMVGITTTMLDGSNCSLNTSRFPFHLDHRSQQEWFGRGNTPFIDHTIQVMRELPSCSHSESPRDGELYVVPGTNSQPEVRGGFIRDLLPAHDPLAIQMQWADENSPPTLDPDHWVHFHITDDRLARTSCNSDASRHPMWDDKPFDRQGYRTLLRSSYDRPDDFDGPQVHVVYAVKNGTPDRQFDTNGLIERSIEHMDRWLFEESGGTGIRFDTYQERLDVTYFPIPTRVTDPTGRDCGGPPCPNETELLDHFKATGKYVEGKQYLFFYDGGITYTGAPGLCGGSVMGRASFVNLDHAIGKTCSFIPWFSPETTEWSIGLLMLHELFHALGAVCDSPTRHSFDSTDLMYGSAGDGSKLDPGRDDYWGNSNGRCPDLSKSPLFTEKSAPFDSPFPQ